MPPQNDGPVQAPCQGVNAKHQAHAEDLSYGNGGGFPDIPDFEWTYKRTSEQINHAH